MADNDGVIRVGTVVDISDLRAQMRAAQAAVKSATDNMAAAQVEFGKAAAQGSEQAAIALKGYETELRSAQSTLQSFSSTSEKATISTRGLSSAAYLAGRELGGGGMGGQLGRVIAQTGLFGGALQALMPYFIGIAAVDVFSNAIEQAKDAYDKFVSLDAVDQKLYDDFKKMQSQDFINVHSIEVANERLTQATEQVSNLRDLAASLKESGWGQILSGNIYGGAEIAAAHAAQQGGADKTRQSIALEEKKLAITHQDNLLRIEAAHSSDAALQGYQRINAELAKKLAIDKEDAEYTRTRDRMEGNIVPKDAGSTDQALKDATAHAQAAAQGLELVRQNAEKAARANQELVSSVQRSTEEVQNQAREISDQQIEIYGGLKKDSELIADSSTLSALEILKKSSKEQLQNIEDITQTGERWKEYNDEVAKGAEIQAQTTATVAEARIAYQEATGQMSKMAAEHQIAAIHAAEYAAKLREIDEEIKKINADSNLTPAQKATQTAGLKNQQSQIQGQAQTSAIQSQTQLAQQAAQPWLTAANQISDAWIEGFNKIIIGGRDSWQAMRKASEQMVMSLIGDAEKYVQKKIETYVMDKVFHATTEAAKVATTQMANATTMASTATTNVALALSYAAVAAAGAAAATAMIPFVGPILAPAAAASTYADTAAYAAMASFDIGTSYIPRDGMAMLHQGEAVLPPPQTEALRDALSGRGGQNGNTGTSFRDFNVNYHGGKQAGPKDMFNLAVKHMRRLNLTT